MDQREIDKQRRCSHILPPPGGEVVRALLDEIEQLQSQPEGDIAYCQVADIEFGKAFTIPEVGRVYIRLGPRTPRIRCLRILPYVESEELLDNLRVRPVNIDHISWSYE